MSLSDIFSSGGRRRPDESSASYNIRTSKMGVLAGIGMVGIFAICSFLYECKDSHNRPMIPNSVPNVPNEVVPRGNDKYDERVIPFEDSYFAVR